MKKTIALMCATALIITACAENTSPLTPNEVPTNTSATVTTQTTTTVSNGLQELTPATAERSILRPLQSMRSLSGESDVFVGELASDEMERWNGFHDYMGTYVAQFRWLSTTLYAEGIMRERAWNERYRTVFEMTFEEAIQAFNVQIDCPSYDGSQEAWDAVECEVFRAYVQTGEEQPVLGWRLNNPNEPNNPEFLEILRYFNVTQDEFQREHERRVEGLSRIEISERQFFEDLIFPIEHIDVLFSDNTLAIMRAALNPWSIMVGDRVFSTQWLLDHSPEEWAVKDVPAEAIALTFEVFRTVLDASQEAAFAAELDVFRREYADS
jgi:hypothetical protein